MKKMVLAITGYVLGISCLFNIGVNEEVEAKTGIKATTYEHIDYRQSYMDNREGLDEYALQWVKAKKFLHETKNK